MDQQIYYEKLLFDSTPQQFIALMHTIQRDCAGLWPATMDTSLEICHVSSERFYDAAIHRGWVLYKKALESNNLIMTLDLNYAAATIELYEIPLKRVTVYFTDGQEPGDYRTNCIGTPFRHFADTIKAEVGLLDVESGGYLHKLPILSQPADKLMVKWLLENPPVPISIVAQRLRISPGTVRKVRKDLRTRGFSI